jgi:hypothetical protein
MQGGIYESESFTHAIRHRTEKNNKKPSLNDIALCSGKWVSGVTQLTHPPWCL